MATSRISYNGKLRTTNEHISSGSVLTTDAPIDNNGLGQDFSPTDLMATSLGACMLTVMAIKAEKRSWELDGMNCEVTKIMATSPRRISEIHVHIELPKVLSDDQRSIMERVALTCPVAQSLSLDIDQQVEFRYI